MKSQSLVPNYRVLILAPTPKDAEVTVQILQNESVSASICRNIAHLCDEINNGADAAILTAESLLSENKNLLEKFLLNQPAWSDFPLIVLAPIGLESIASTKALEELGNITIINRPLKIATLLTSLRMALRDRHRQYSLRDYLIQHEKNTAAIQASEQRTKAVIDTALDAVIITNDTGIIIEWNHQAEIVFGWSRDEAMGQQMASMIIPEHYIAAHQYSMSRYLVTGEKHILDKRIEITARNKAGIIFPVELAVTAQSINGKIFFTSFSRDITERLATEQNLRDTREHLELMMDSARDFAIISIDKTGNIISWNYGAELIFGYSASEVIGQSFEIIFTDHDRAAGVPQKELANAVTNGHATDERWHIRKNGECFYASGMLAAMVKNEGNIKGFIKIARDMTLQKAAEEALISARNAAEAANIAKTEFMANMSHEIRTPMNAVIGLSNILSISNPLTDKQRDYIKTLQTSADSLLELINDLLDIAKIEACTVDLEQVPFSLAQIMQQVASMVSVRMKERGLDFFIDDNDVEGRMFIGDPTRFRQIILNLCSNAAKFTESGHVRVIIKCQPTDNPEMETVNITISDTGIGIAQEKLESIFEKFVQADSSINRKYGGTGLGLAITKTLTEIMGGTIKVESELGKGSVFTISIPLTIAQDTNIQKADQSLAKIIQSSAKVTRTTILLVEDYAPNILVATTFLENFGYAYEIATNGLEAVEKVKDNNYSAVLMDVQMHGMNGLEATQIIRQREKDMKLPHIPILGMTAHALAGDRERCISVGMDDYIAKPFNPLELQQKITELLSYQ